MPANRRQEILTQPVAGPAAWFGADIADQAAWSHRLSTTTISEIDAALDSVKANGLSFPAFIKSDFPLTDSLPLLAQLIDEMEQGRGFVRLQGLSLIHI